MPATCIRGPRAMRPGYGRHPAATVRVVSDPSSPHVIRRLDGDLVLRRAEAGRRRRRRRPQRRGVRAAGRRRRSGRCSPARSTVEWLVVAAGPGAERPGGGTLAARVRPDPPRLRPRRGRPCRAARSSTSRPTSGSAAGASCGPSSTPTTGGPRRPASCSRSSAGSRTSTGSSGTATASTCRPRSRIGPPVGPAARHQPGRGPTRPARRRRLAARRGGRAAAVTASPSCATRAVVRDLDGPHRRRSTARPGSRSSSPRSPADRSAGSAPSAWADGGPALPPARRRARPRGRRPAARPRPSPSGQRLADQHRAARRGPRLRPARHAVEPGGARRRPTRAPSRAATTRGSPTRWRSCGPSSPCCHDGWRRRASPHDRGELSLSLYDRGVLLAWERRPRDARSRRADARSRPVRQAAASAWRPTGSRPSCSAGGARSGLADRTDDTLLGDHTTVMDVLFPARPNDLVADL